jgi:hypothetical protein
MQASIYLTTLHSDFSHGMMCADSTVGSAGPALPTARSRILTEPEKTESAVGFWDKTMEGCGIETLWPLPGNRKTKSSLCLFPGRSDRCGAFTRFSSVERFSAVFCDWTQSENCFSFASQV